MKNQLLILCLFSFFWGCEGCKSIDKKQLQRVWVMKEAIHIDQNGGRGRYYVRGQGGNLLNYDPFLLDLTSADALKFTDVAKGGDRFDFVGKWRVEQNVKLVLFDLSPEPTCTDGVDCAKDGIQFFIDSIKDNELKINRLYRSDKTGDTVNEYTLIPN